MARPTIASLQAEIEALRLAAAAREEELTKAKAPIGDFSDPRLEPLFEAAYEAADSHGYCEVFDEVLEEIGAPSRKKDVTITLEFRARVSGDHAELLEDMRQVVSTAVLVPFYPEMTITDARFRSES